MRQYIHYALALALCPVVFLSCDEVARPGRKTVATDSVSVNVTRIEVAPDVCGRTYVGRVEASQNTVVSSQTSGTVESINVKKGRRVKAGEVIAVVKSQNTESAYAMAKATLEQARDGYDRMMQVYPKGGVTEVQRMEVTTQLHKAEASFEAAESALEKCRIKAPYSGVVDEIFIEQGVEVSLMAPVARVLNVSNVEIHFPVPENEIAEVALGEESSVEIPAADKTIKANLTVKGADASPLAHTYDCVLVPSESCPEILPGMVCKVRLANDRGNKIIIPMRSVMTDNSGRYVWCADNDGVISKKRIVCDGFAEDGVIVSEGLAEGDLLVVEGQRKISSGMKVKIKQL